MARLVSPDPAQLAENLLGLWRGRTTLEDVDAGLRWYADARSFAQALARRHGLPLETAACAIAALSPQLEWGANMRAAEAVLEGRKPGAVLGRSVAIAQAVIRDRATTPDAYYKDAPKVRSFARNISGLTDYVTVDTHAAEAAHNDVTQIPKVARFYDVYVDAYRRAAAETGLTPAAFQAVIWTTWKRIHTPESKRAIRRKVAA